jgi:hypothetical protein
LHRSRTPGVLNDVQVAQEPQMVSIVRKLHKKTTPGVVTNVKVVQEQSPTCVNNVQSAEEQSPICCKLYANCTGAKFQMQ